MLNLTETEKAYLAGLFDGEGTVGYYFKTKLKYHLAQVAIYNSDPRIMVWIKARLPFGSIATNKVTQYRGWSWVASGKNNLKEFLLAIRPYLIIKANQVDLLLSLWDAEQKIRSPRRKLPQEVIDLRNSTVIEMKRLKTANFQSIH